MQPTFFYLGTLLTLVATGLRQHSVLGVDLMREWAISQSSYRLFVRFVRVFEDRRLEIPKQ